MTYRQAVQHWRRYIKPSVPPRDKPALRESWNNFTDELCKDGEITLKQYESWGQPKDAK